MRAVLIEFPDEADCYLRACRQRGVSPDRDALIVALTPAVRAHLEAQAVSCESTLPYFDGQSHRRVVRALDAMTRSIREALEAPEGFVVRTAYRDSLVNVAWAFLGHLLKLIEILDRVNEAHDIRRWVACRIERTGTGESNPFIQPDERYLPELIRDVASLHGQLFEEHVETTTRPIRPAARSNSWMLDRLTAKLYSLLFRRLARRPVGMVTNLSYNMDEVVRQSASEFPDLTWLWLDIERHEGGAVELKKCLKRMARLILRHERGPFAIPLRVLATAHPVPEQRSHDLRRWIRSQIRRTLDAEPSTFTYLGISLAGRLWTKVSEDAVPYEADILQDAWTLERILGEISPRFVLAQASYDAYCALGELCERRKIPAILISHGSLAPAREDEARIGMEHISRRLIRSTYTDLAIQSPVALRYVDAEAGPGRRHLTGPLIWSRLRSDGRDPKWRTVVHASTPRARQANHFFISETQDEYIQSIIDVIGAVESVEDCNLIVRFRPQPQFSVENLLALLPKSDRLTVSWQGRFSDTLARADLLVSFYSTTIEEALQNRIPVLLYGGEGRYCHLPAVEIVSDAPPPLSAVYFVSDRQYLNPAIRHLVNRHGGQRLPDELLSPYRFEEAGVTPLTKILSAFLSDAGRCPAGGVPAVGNHAYS